MDALPTAVRQAGTDLAADFDAIAIGAGISRLLPALQVCANSALRCECSKTGTSFGSLWYWNRYPGAHFYGHRRLSRGAVDCQHLGLFQKFRRS